MIVEGFATRTAREIGILSVVTVSAGAGEQTLVYASYSAEEPKEGDFLEHGVNQDLKIISRVIFPAAAKSYKVEEPAGVDVVAVPAAEDYAVKIPAVSLKFRGRVVGIPVTGGGVALTCAAAIQINAKPVITIGSPDLPNP